MGSFAQRWFFAMGHFIFSIYLVFIAVLGGAGIVEFTVFCLKKYNILEVSNESLSAEILMLMGLLVGSPIIAYVIKINIPKDRKERNKI